MSEEDVGLTWFKKPPEDEPSNAPHQGKSWWEKAWEKLNDEKNYAEQPPEEVEGKSFLGFIRFLMD
jgi:hypothetical protein